MNAREMEQYCTQIRNVLSDGGKADELCARAAARVEEVADNNFHRDNIRSQPFTDKVIARCEREVGDAAEMPEGTGDCRGSS